MFTCSPFLAMARCWLDFLMLTVNLAVISTLSVQVTYASQGPGRPLTAIETAQLNRHIFADGTGLPDGSGSVAQGEILYLSHCSECHGHRGQGGKAVELIGDRQLLASDYPDKGIGVVWPYAPTLFEYINRAMPPAMPMSFNSSQLYSLVGYLLYVNGLIAPDALVDRGTLTGVVMPNQNGFVDVYRSTNVRE
jgi:cytochrome c